MRPSRGARCGGRRPRSPDVSWPGYLQSLDEDFGRVHGLPVESRVGADTRPIEVLSLH